MWKAILALPLVVSGCMSVNPITAVQLARINPMAADPAGMAVQLVLPDGVGVEAGSAQLSLSVEAASGERLDGIYPLEPLPGDVWRVTPEAQARLRADQARAVAWETADPDGTSGSFSASLQPCAVGDGPAADARLSLRLQLEPEAAFLPLLNGVPVRTLYDEAGVEGLGPCAAG